MAATAAKRWGDWCNKNFGLNQDSGHEQKNVRKSVSFKNLIGCQSIDQSIDFSIETISMHQKILNLFIFCQNYGTQDMGPLKLIVSHCAIIDDVNADDAILEAEHPD